MIAEPEDFTKSPNSHPKGYFPAAIEPRSKERADKILVAQIALSEIHIETRSVTIHKTPWVEYQPVTEAKP